MAGKGYKNRNELLAENNQLEKLVHQLTVERDDARDALETKFKAENAAKLQVTQLQREFSQLDEAYAKQAEELEDALATKKELQAARQQDLASVQYWKERAGVMKGRFMILNATFNEYLARWRDV